MTREIHDEILIASDPEHVFDVLIKPSWIKKWWLATSAIVIPEPGGLYALSWGEDPDQPDYVTFARITALEKPGLLHLRYETYLSSTGKLPFDADFEVRFITAEEEGNTKLSVHQTGFPLDSIADEYYQGCIQGWQDTLKWIKFAIENNP